MMKRRRLASRELQQASPNPYDPRITPIEKPRPVSTHPATSATIYTAPSTTAYTSQPPSTGYTEHKIETATVSSSWQWPAAMPHTPMTPTSPMSFDIERGMSRAEIRMSAATASTDWVHLDLRLSSPTPSMLRAYPGRIGSPSPEPHPPSPRPILGIPCGVHDANERLEEEMMRPSFDSFGFAMPPPTYRSPSRQTDLLVPVSAGMHMEGGGLHVQIPQAVRARAGVGPPF